MRKHRHNYDVVQDAQVVPLMVAPGPFSVRAWASFLLAAWKVWSSLILVLWVRSRCASKSRRVLRQAFGVYWSSEDTHALDIGASALSWLTRTSMTVRLSTPPDE